VSFLGRVRWKEPRRISRNAGAVPWRRTSWVAPCPPTHIPGGTLEIPDGHPSHEISAVVVYRIKMFPEGYLTIEERLTRWGLLRWVGTKIRQFHTTMPTAPRAGTKFSLSSTLLKEKFVKWLN
jgi:hypothetical protein